MKNIKIIIICAALLGCNVACKTHLPSKTWDEAGYNADSDIVPGINGYKGLSINYKRNGKSILTVRLEDPVIVGVAAKEEKWGFFQFPGIYRSLDNAIVAKWNMCPDDIAFYGKWDESYSISNDEGKSWSLTQKEPVIGGGLILPDGDRIEINTPPSLKVEDLQLPKPVWSNKDVYGREIVYYKHSELPKVLQGVYLNRLTKGSASWTMEHEVLNDSLAVRESDWGMFPVTWWGDMRISADGSIIAGIYPGYILGEDGTVDLSGISFYRSTDKGHTWDYQGRISIPALQSETNGNTLPVVCFYEPGFEILSDGSFLCVMRTGDVSPMYFSRSTDQGRTWSKPEAFTRNGVLPRLLQMDNGVIVLASGRPGVQLRFCTDGKGEKWTDPFEMLPFEYKKKELYYEYSATCGYTGLLSVGPDSFLLIYSDFKYQTQTGQIRKAIKVRHVVVTPIVTCK